jgi:spermidine synthase
MSQQRPQDAPGFPTILVIFFLSGIAGLLYEVAWFRRLQLVFGVSTFAMGAVVSAFMFGLAAGSGWAGSASAVRKRPLMSYGLLEAAIAVYALLFPGLVIVAEKLYSSVFSQLEGQFLVLSALRFGLSLLLLVPATFCMGATLPTLALVVAEGSRSTTPRLGWLYSANTFGGVVGTLAAGFFALEHFGIRGTIWIGAALNALIACAAVVLSRHASLPQTERAGPVKKATGKRMEEPAVDARYAVLLVGLAGLVSMALELVWTRALVFYVHNSTYAFSAILAVYLLGLAGGAAAGARLSTSPNVMRWIGLTVAAICLSTLVAIAIYRHLPALMRPLLGHTLPQELAGLPDRSFWIVRSWVTALGAIFLQVAAVLFVPAFCFGLLFPLALRLAEGSAGEPSSIVGRLYAVNTLGSMAGTVLGSFLLVPLLGTQGALVLLAWFLAPIGLLALKKATIGASRFRWPIVGVGLCALLGLTVVAAPAGFYRDMFARRFGKVLWFSEGVSETVAVCEHTDGSAWIHYSDGRGASGTYSFLGGWLYAHLPILLHPDPRSALVICFGTGNTLGAARLHPLERVDGVELSSEVVKASKFFKETNHDVARDPRVRIVIEDGRNYLLGTTNRYDIITEEPPLVHTAGVVNLYSKDFYNLCEQRLTDNGIMAVWLATWELEEPEVKMLVRAFVDVFPQVSAWDSRHLGEWILIGSKKPLVVDAENLRRRMSEPLLSRDLGKIGVRSPADLLALHLKGGEFLKAYTADVSPVTDDRSVVDYTIPRQARANYGLGEFTTGGLYLSGVGPNGLISELRAREFDRIYTSRDPADPLLGGTDAAARASLVEEIKQRRLEAEADAGRKLAWNVMASASDYQELKEPEKSLEVLDWGLGIVTGPARADLLVKKAEFYNRSGRSQEAREALAGALALNPKHPSALKLAAEMK